MVNPRGRSSRSRQTSVSVVTALLWTRCEFLRNVGLEMVDLARPARVSYVDEAQPVGEPCGRDLVS